MEIYHRTIRMARWAGVLPATRKNVWKGVKGDEYVLSKKAMIFFILQIFTLFWMVVQFKGYQDVKSYYPELRMFQISVLMYCEVSQSTVVVVLSILFRFPNLEPLLRKCNFVLKDLKSVDVPYYVRHSGFIAITSNTLFTLYRVDNSLNRKKLMLPFWIGMAQVIMVKVVLLVFFSIVDSSYKKINKDLGEIISKPSRNTKFLQLSILHVCQKHQNASDLFISIVSNFGPDVFCMCFFFVFKVTFALYHLNLSFDESLWGKNTLLAELTGYIQILQITAYMFSLVYVSDSLTKETRETQILLLILRKDLLQRKSPELTNTINTFLLQVKSQPKGFSVCHHFMFTKELLYNMLWGAVTYVLVLIQFQDLTEK